VSINQKPVSGASRRVFPRQLPGYEPWLRKWSVEQDIGPKRAVLGNQIRPLAKGSKAVGRA